MLSCQLYHLYLSMLFMYSFYALYCIAPAWVFLLYLFISSSVVFIYLLYSPGDVLYFPALVISYRFGTYDFH